MVNENHPDWRTKLTSFIGIATIFLMVATAVMTIEFFNHLKENDYIGQSLEFRSEITVAGQAEKFVKPDLAVINLGVTTEEETVSEVMQENTRIMNDIIEALKEDALSDENIKTKQFNLSPRYEWRTKSDYIEGERILVGYQITQTLEARISDFDKIGAIIQKAADLGANQIGALTFIIEDEDIIKNELREEAIAQAKGKAKELASQLGVSLKRIIYFREEVPTTLWARGAGDMAYKESIESPMTPSIQSGESKVEVNVSITYEIN